MHLTQENNKLVKKIEGIHFRPTQFPFGASDKEDAVKASARRNSSTTKRGSLNYNTRRIENERIFKENMMLFSKLKSSKPNLRKTDFDDAYS